jgi:hypothetical protein
MPRSGCEGRDLVTSAGRSSEEFSGWAERRDADQSYGTYDAMIRVSLTGSEMLRISTAVSQEHEVGWNARLLLQEQEQEQEQVRESRDQSTKTKSPR